MPPRCSSRACSPSRAPTATTISNSPRSTARSTSRALPARSKPRRSRRSSSACRTVTTASRSQSLANGGNQALIEYVNVYSGPGNNTVRLANGHDVSDERGRAPARSRARRRRQARRRSGHLDQPNPNPNPNPDPNPNPNSDPPTNWFTTQHRRRGASNRSGSSLYTDNVINRSDMIALFTERGRQRRASTPPNSPTCKKIVNNSTLFAGPGLRRAALRIHRARQRGQRHSITGQALGNLVAGSTTAQLTNLVNKWFLGLDRPTAERHLSPVRRPAVRERRRLHRHQPGPGRRLLLDGLAGRSGAPQPDGRSPTCSSSTATARTP